MERWKILLLAKSLQPNANIDVWRCDWKTMCTAGLQEMSNGFQHLPGWRLLDGNCVSPHFVLAKEGLAWDWKGIDRILNTGNICSAVVGKVTSGKCGEGCDGEHRQRDTVSKLVALDFTTNIRSVLGSCHSVHMWKMFWLDLIIIL